MTGKRCGPLTESNTSNETQSKPDETGSEGTLCARQTTTIHTIVQLINLRLL